MWDARTGVLLQTCQEPESYNSGGEISDPQNDLSITTKLVFTLDDKSLMSVRRDGQVRIWSYSTLSINIYHNHSHAGDRGTHQHITSPRFLKSRAIHAIPSMLYHTQHQQSHEASPKPQVQK